MCWIIWIVIHLQLVYWYCVAAVFDLMLFLLRAAVFMDLNLLLLQFSEKEWGPLFTPQVLVCTSFSLFVSTLLILVRKIITAIARAYPIRPQFFCSYFYRPCIVLLIFFVANKRSFGLPTGVTGLFAIGSGNLPCCLATYVEKVI